MKNMKNILDLLPGSSSVNIILFTLGTVLALISLKIVDSTIAALVAGFGASMFIAGFIGLVNLKVLSKEISSITKEPFEDISLYLKIHKSGIRNIFRSRGDSIDTIFDDVQKEHGEIVIVSSSLKGLIGVGYDSSMEEETCRKKIIDSLQRNVTVNILMTNPEIAANRAHQEGRREGDIEAEILRNLMYFVQVRLMYHDSATNLNIKLYNGTPTIFMVCTSRLMLLNPYPYYSTAYNSFSFLIDGGSDLFRTYYKSHFQEAWKDSDMTLTISHDANSAIKQIKTMIELKSPRDSNKFIIPELDKRKELHDLLKVLDKMVSNKLSCTTIDVSD